MIKKFNIHSDKTNKAEEEDASVNTNQSIKNQTIEKNASRRIMNF